MAYTGATPDYVYIEDYPATVINMKSFTDSMKRHQEEMEAREQALDRSFALYPCECEQHRSTLAPNSDHRCSKCRRSYAWRVERFLR